MNDDAFLSRQAERDERVRDDSRALTEPESNCGPFETKKAIEIMKLYCKHVSQREIARQLRTSSGNVNRTVKYWRSNYGALVEALRRQLT